MGVGLRTEVGQERRREEVEEGAWTMKRCLVIATILAMLGWTIWFIIGEHMSSIVDNDCPSGHCSKNGGFQ